MEAFGSSEIQTSSPGGKNHALVPHDRRGSPNEVSRRVERSWGDDVSGTLEAWVVRNEVL